MPHFDLTQNLFYQDGLDAAREAIARTYELAPGKSADPWAAAREAAVRALQDYLAYHQTDGGSRVDAILTRLRDGRASRVDYREVVALANLSSKTITAIKTGRASTPTTPSLQTRYEMVRAFDALLGRQGILRTAIETVKDRFQPSPSVAPTSYQQQVRAEVGPKYELVVEKEVLASMWGGGSEWRPNVGIYPVEGAGGNARSRAAKLAETIMTQHRHGAHVDSMEAGGGMPASRVRIGIRQVGDPDRDAVTWVAAETFNP